MEFGHLSLQELRSSLGWSQAQLAREVCVSTRTILRIEKGLHKPRPILQQRLFQFFRKKNPDLFKRAQIKTRLIDARRMRKYFTRVSLWRSMTKQQRATFWSWKANYRRILADAQAGRCLIVYKNRR